MELNGLRIVGTTLVVAGLLTGTFLAGNLSAGDKPSPSSGPPQPTPLVVGSISPVNEDSSQPPSGSGATGVTPEEPASPGLTEAGVQSQSPVSPPSEPLSGASEQPIVIIQPISSEPTPPSVEATPVPQFPTAEPTPESPDPTPAPPTPIPPTPAPPTPTPAPENDPPSVVLLSPIDGAIGIAPDANIVVGFSEPMDKDSVEFAFSISTGKCGVFAWNSDATQVTFNPCNDWAYGTNVDIGIHESASDTLGLEMAESFEFSFRVLRQTTTKLYSEADRDGHVYGKGYVSPDAGIFFVSRVARGFVSFDLSLLPSSLVEIQAASVHARQEDSMIGAYGPLTGNVLIESLSYGSLSSSDYYQAPFKLCPKICLGSAPTSRLFSDNPLDGWKSADMLTAVRADWQDREARGDRSQFRLRYEKECGGSPCQNVVALTFYADGSLYRPYLLVTYTYP